MQKTIIFFINVAQMRVSSDEGELSRSDELELETRGLRLVLPLVDLLFRNCFILLYSRKLFEIDHFNLLQPKTEIIFFDKTMKKRYPEKTFSSDYSR